MAITVKYIGTADNYAEIAVTGKQSVWQVGQQEERSDVEAGQLLATGLFSSAPLPVMASANLTGLVETSSAGIKIFPALGIQSARPDGVALYDASVAVTSGGITAISSPDGAWKEGDIGKLISFYQKVITGYVYRRGVISNVSADGLTAYCTLTLAVASAVTPCVCIYGSDTAAALDANLASARLNNGDLQLASGIYCISRSIVIPQGVDVIGKGRNKAIGDPTLFEYAGTSVVLCALLAGADTYAVKLSDSGGTHNKPGAGLYDCNVDAMSNAYYAVDMSGGYGCEMERVSAARPSAALTNSACVFTGNCSRIYNCFFDSHSYGMGIRSYQKADLKIKNNWLSSGGENAYNAAFTSCVDVQYQGNHSFKNATSPGTGGQVLVETTSATGPSKLIDISNNIFDTSKGPHVKITVTGNYAKSVAVSNNMVFQNDAIAASTYPCFEINVASGGSLIGCKINDNHGTSSFVDQAIGIYSELLKTTNAGTIYLDEASGNQIAHCDALFTGRVPSTHRANEIRVGVSTNVARCTNLGKYVGNGTAAQTAFVFPHGLGGTPANIIVTPGAAGAASASYATADATNITVTFSVAPASGTGNVVLNWSASL